MELNEPWWIDVIKALLIANVVLLAFAYATLLERKLLGRMHLRYGPNRVGPFGLLQPIADLVKLIRKESFAPTAAVDVLFYAAPALAAFTALASFAVIPFGGVWHWGPYDVTGNILDVPIALVLLFSLGAVGVYAFLIGGWASESKYSLLGSMRTAAQLVSYEVSLALSVLGVVTGEAVTASSNGTSKALKARVNRRLRPGVVRIAGEHAHGLADRVEVVKA